LSTTDTASTNDGTDTSSAASSDTDQTPDETQQATAIFGMPMAEMARIIATYGAAQMAATAVA